MKAAAAEASAEAAHEPAVQATLIQRLSDENWWMRAAAAEALTGVSHEPAAQAALSARLDDRNADARRTVSAGLFPKLSKFSPESIEKLSREDSPLTRFPRRRREMLIPI